MQVRTLTAIDGWRWLGGGFALFRRNPAMLTLLMLGCWMSLLTINHLPLIGWPLASLAIPAFSVSLMNACRDLDQGRMPGFQLLLSGFRQQLRPLLILGAFYFATFLMALMVSAIVDGGLFLQTMLGRHQPTDEEMSAGTFLIPMQITLLVLLPAMMAMWFAPVLVAWHDFPPGKALFFSFVACLRNWLPFLTYGLAVLLFGGVLPSALLILAMSLLPADPRFMIALFMLPMFFIYAPSVIASFYVSYRDVFRGDETPPVPVIDEEV